MKALQVLLQLFVTGFATVTYRSEVKTAASSSLKGLKYSKSAHSRFIRLIIQP